MKEAFFLLMFLGWVMKISIHKLVLVLFLFTGNLAFGQGPFPPAADSAGTTAIHKDSNIIYGWINNCTVTRGFQDIANQSGPLASVGDETMVYGKANLSVVSLGDGGEALIELANPIANHAGYDFAVFENGFYDMANGGYFLELAFVEVSSNGVDFYRFPNQSLTPTDSQTGSFGTTDPTQIDGYAGKYTGFYGVPFDLTQLDQIFGLDVNNITHIKIIDVVGNINSTYATYDDSNRIVNDPYPTSFSSGGFDLDAIALIDYSLATGVDEVVKLDFTLFPNPAQNTLHFTGVEGNFDLFVFDIRGNKLIQTTNTQTQLDISNLTTGVYFLQIQTENGVATRKFIKE